MEKSENYNCIYRQTHIENNTYKCNITGTCTTCQHQTHYTIINDNSQPTTHDIPVTITTSKRRKPTIQRTIRYLKKAGFTRITTIDDTTKGPPIGIYANWLTAAIDSSIRHPQDNWHIITQDDIFISNNICHHLTNLDNNTVYSLFAPQALLDNTEPGWYATNNYMAGPNILLIPTTILNNLITNKTALTHCIKSRINKSAYDDLGIFTALTEMDIPVAFHNPNFSMHWGINSTHNRHQNSKMIFSDYAAGEYYTDITNHNISTITINSNISHSINFLISQYYETGNVELIFATGMKNQQFTHDPHAFKIIIKENDGPVTPIELTDRVFWTQ
jgi:hypothetical protein